MTVAGTYNPALLAYSANNSAQAGQVSSAEMGLKNALQKGAEDKAELAAKDFESVFITQMLQLMFENVDNDELYGGGLGADIMKSLMLNEYGTVIAKSGGIGVADAVQRELIRIQSQGQ